MAMEVIAICVVGLIMCGALGLLIALGRVIYKDAKAMGMPAGLWTAIVVFVPNFIGLVIYLVVRSNAEKKYNCSKCGEDVKGDYNVCPNCKSLFEKICQVCKNAVKSNMTYCPYCGNKVEGEEAMQTATKVTKKTNIIKPLAIIGGTYIGIVVVAMGIMFTMAFASGDFTSSSSFMEVEMNTGRKMESTFKYKSGTERMSFKLDKGEQQDIAVAIGLTEGEIKLVVKDPTDQVIHEKSYGAGNDEETVTIEANTQGKYTVYLNVEKASGNYKVHRAE